MRIRFLLLIIVFHGLLSYGQNPAYKIRHYLLNDGVYLSSKSLYNNSPEIRSFKAEKNQTENGNYQLFQSCSDSLHQDKLCEIKDCWGFVLEGKLFIALSAGGYFKAQIVGALVHMIDIESVLVEHSPNYSQSPYYYSNYYTNGPVYSRRNTANEYVIDIESGERIYFNYKSFRQFLRKKDPELSNELENSKQKRKLIYFFLMKYNDRHILNIPYTE